MFGWFAKGHRSLFWRTVHTLTLVETSLERPPFYIGHFLLFSRWSLSRASTLSPCRRSDNSFQFHLVICFCISGYLIPACLMVATSYVGCNSTSLAVVLFSLALGASNLNAATYRVNHLDIAPRFSGVLMGITNSAAPISGIIGPFVVGLLKDNQVCFWRDYYILFRLGWFQVMDLTWYWIAPFLCTWDRSVDENRPVVVPFLWQQWVIRAVF